MTRIQVKFKLLRANIHKNVYVLESLVLRDNCIAEEQKEIGDKLLERYDKNLDRFISLLQFVFVMLGVYSSIVIHYEIMDEIATLINEAKSISYFSQPIYLLISFIMCYASVIFAILTLVYRVKMENPHFDKVGDLVQFEEGDKLKKRNCELLSSIEKQSAYYNAAILLIMVSLFSFIEYFLLRDPNYKSMDSVLIALLFIIIGFFVGVIQLLIFFIKDICTLLGIYKKISYGKDTLIAWINNEVIGRKIVTKEEPKGKI